MMGNLVLLVAFATSILLTLLSVIALKAWRKRDDRRSPLQGKKLYHVPGKQLLDRVNDHGENILLSVIVMYFAFPIMLLAWALTRTRWESVRLGWTDGLYVLGGAAMFLWGLRDFIKHWDARARAKDGLIAEQMTAQQLNRLSGPRCIVLHDLPGEGFNIDHVVIAPNAVYAVETKSFRKRRGSSNDSHYKVRYDGKALFFEGWSKDEPILQARRQAQWLARYLRDSLGCDVRVVPAVALPGWWIDWTESASRSDVKVFTPMGRGAEFMLKPPDVIDERTRPLISQALGLRYPDIED